MIEGFEPLPANCSRASQASSEVVPWLSLVLETVEHFSPFSNGTSSRWFLGEQELDEVVVEGVEEAILAFSAARYLFLKCIIVFGGQSATFVSELLPKLVEALLLLLLIEFPRLLGLLGCSGVDALLESLLIPLLLLNEAGPDNFDDCYVIRINNR